jgi:hypothetical protein
MVVRLPAASEKNLPETIGKMIGTKNGIESVIVERKTNGRRILIIGTEIGTGTETEGRITNGAVEARDIIIDMRTMRIGRRRGIMIRSGIIGLQRSITERTGRKGRGMGTGRRRGRGTEMERTKRGGRVGSVP